MKIIGITGKSGSGKSTLANLLSQELKCDYIDIDKIGHKATKEPNIVKKLCTIFGEEILGENRQQIDRKKLGNIVFSSKEKMDILTQITWGYMQEELDAILRKKPKIILLEWALLPIDKKYWEKCDIKILLQAKDELRKNKVMERDQIAEEYFLKREANSMDYSNFEFDFIFENDYQPQTLEKIVNAIK